MGCRTWKIKIKYCPWPFSAIALSISKAELRGATVEASRPPQNPYHQVHRETDQQTRALSHANTLLLFLVNEGLKLRLCRESILLHIYPLTADRYQSLNYWANPAQGWIQGSKKGPQTLSQQGRGWDVPAGPVVKDQREACAPQLEEACAQQWRSRAAINK